ncbi:efflux RND transporter periplasmic adaptor subunit [bacterium]|nr:efflux RND transporter periplasmic adaptor subunit [bacterium]
MRSAGLKAALRACVAVASLALFLAAATWIVRRYRSPGSMTVLESQSMDMRSMKLPVGPMPVATAVVEMGIFVPTVTYSGTVVAQGDQEITARVTGVVQDVPVYPGDRVLPGQLLVRLDSAELASKVEEARTAKVESQQRVRALQAEWRASLGELQAAQVEVPVVGTQVAEARETSRAAQVELETVRAEYARSLTLHGQGAISLEELQLDRARLAEARASHKNSLLRFQKASLEVSRAQAQVKARQGQTQSALRNIDTALAAQQRSQAAEHTAEVQLGYTQILATSPSEVVERVVSPGTLVMPGQVLLRLKQGGRVRLQALVPVDQAVHIQTGFPVKARIGGKLIRGRVNSIFRSADPQTRTLVVEALAKPERELVPGAYLTMEISVATPLSGLSMPLAAMHKDAEGVTFVWKVAGQKAGTSVYTCVMHPEVRLPNPGKCPKCGMTLVLEKPTGASVARRQIITPGPVSGERVAVGKGLQAGDEVIVEGYQDLSDGMAVKAVNWEADGPLELPAVQPHQEAPHHGDH